MTIPQKINVVGESKEDDGVIVSPFSSLKS